MDAHSKCPEIHEMPTTTADNTIEVLQKMFSVYGLPEQVVSDNGPQFTSAKFELFMKGNGIKHIRADPYRPALNGAAERLVQSFKQAMKASVNNGLTMQQQLENLLLLYCITPHATTGESPSKLFMGRQLHTRLDLVRCVLKNGSTANSLVWGNILTDKQPYEISR